MTMYNYVLTTYLLSLLNKDIHLLVSDMHGGSSKTMSMTLCKTRKSHLRLEQGSSSTLQFNSTLK